MSAVISKLQKDGFAEVYDEAEFNGQTFIVDDHAVLAYNKDFH